MQYLILVLFVISWVIFILNVLKNKRLDGFYLKGMTSFIFVFLFFYGSFHLLTDKLNLITESTVLVMVGIGLGLVLGLIGDLFLEVQYFYKSQKTKQIKYGMIIFGLGHIFYLIAMDELVSFTYWAVITGLIMTLIIILSSKKMQFDFGKLKYFSYGYSFIIFTMVGQSVFQAINLNFNIFSLLFMIGALLFGISDLLLAPIYFKKDSSKVFVVANLATYYGGQAFIALSIYYLL
jgi:uncharacterized membrane protein YhhN